MRVERHILALTRAQRPTGTPTCCNTAWTRTECDNRIANISPLVLPGRSIVISATIFNASAAAKVVAPSGGIKEN